MTAQDLLSNPKTYWGLAIVVAGLLVLLPNLDIWFSGLFFSPDGQMWVQRTPAMQFARSGAPPLIIGSVVFFLLLFIAGKVFGEVFWQATGRRITYLLTTLVLGPGLIVESLLKTQVGRARPRDTTLFGGPEEFTAALLPSDACMRNCSFVSGHAALAFWVTAYAFLLPPPFRMPVMVCGFALGVLMGLTRIMEGAHFMSDIVFAGLIVVSVNVWLASRIRPINVTGKGVHGP